MFMANDKHQGNRGNEKQHRPGEQHPDDERRAPESQPEYQRDRSSQPRRDMDQEQEKERKRA
jgi:hypothetical protein